MEIVSVGLLVGVLAFAVVRPLGWPEAVAAVPAAGAAVAIGAISPQHAVDEVVQLLDPGYFQYFDRLACCRGSCQQAGMQGGIDMRRVRRMRPASQLYPGQT